MVNWNVAGSVDVSFFSPLQPTTATAASNSRHWSLRMRGNMSQSEVLRKRGPDGVLEALRVRLDRPRRLVEEDALHAEQRHEHGDQVEVRLVLVRHLADPVVEGVEVDPAQGDA